MKEPAPPPKKKSFHELVLNILFEMLLNEGCIFVSRAFKVDALASTSKGMEPNGTESVSVL